MREMLLVFIEPMLAAVIANRAEDVEKSKLKPVLPDPRHPCGPGEHARRRRTTK
jgi:hypothetical protein